MVGATTIGPPDSLSPGIPFNAIENSSMRSRLDRAELPDTRARGRLPPVYRKSSYPEEDITSTPEKLEIDNGRRFGGALVSNQREAERVLKRD